MSTVRITVPGADFSSRNLGRVLKLTTDRTNLVGEYILGGNLAASKYNGANPDLPMSVVGTPTYSDGHVTLGQNNWFDTFIQDAAELTMMLIADAASTGSIYLGNFNGLNTVDCILLYKNNSNIVAQSSASDGTTQTLDSSVSGTGANTDFRGLAMRTVGSTDYVSKLDHFKGGVRAAGGSQTNTGKTREVQSTPTFAIGSSRGNAFFPGPVNVAAALVWHRALTDAELLAAYLEVRSVMAGRGVDC